MCTPRLGVPLNRTLGNHQTMEGGGGGDADADADAGLCVLRVEAYPSFSGAQAAFRNPWHLVLSSARPPV